MGALEFKSLIINLIIMSIGRLTEQRYERGKAILRSLIALKNLTGYEYTTTFHDTFKNIAQIVGLGSVADKIIRRYERENRRRGSNIT